jgi:hypothetical protein
VRRTNDTEPNNYTVHLREDVEHTFSIDPSSPLFIGNVLPEIVETFGMPRFLRS